MQPALIIHAGAGRISENRYEAKLDVVKRAVKAGYSVLKKTENPIDAVEAAVRLMEDDESCNAGYGSVLTRDGDVEQDAIIIRGSDLAMGGVGAVRHIKNPISVARAVMEKSNHVLLVGPGAEKFATDNGFELVENSELVSPRSQRMLEAILAKQIAATTEISDVPTTPHVKIPNEGGTVGAVAINSKGQLAAATSTGGLYAKLSGRVGDTPIPGGGTICNDDVCGISATGLGEAIMRACVCSRISNLIENGVDINDACLTALNYMTSKIPEGDGGAIGITKDGQVGFNFNSKNMGWAYIKDKKLRYGIEKGNDFEEDWIALEDEGVESLTLK